MNTAKHDHPTSETDNSFSSVPANFTQSSRNRRKPVGKLLALSAVLPLCVGSVVSASSVLSSSAAVASPVVNADSTDTGTTNTVSTDRLQGKTRFETSAAISKAAFPNGSSVAYIARGDVLADALSGGMLTSGPVLLVPAGNNPPAATLAEVKRLGAKKVIALGGADVVSSLMLSRVAQGATTQRLAGADRYATAVAISKHEFPAKAEDVYLANGWGLADAVAGGSLTTGPVLPVPAKGVLPEVIRKEVKRLAPLNITALGGVDVVSDAIRKTANPGQATLKRIGGATRYDTSAGIASESFPNGAEVVYLAQGSVFADAVSAGSLTEGPVMLVNGRANLSKALAWVQKNRPAKVVALGGEDVVSKAVLDRFVLAAQGTVVNPTAPTDPIIKNVPTAPSVPAGWTANEFEVLKLTNVERAKVGAPALAPQSCLQKIARNWSNDMAQKDVLEHGSFDVRIKACYNNSWAGENIANDWGSPKATVEAWMKSPGHKENILNPRYRFLGVGISSNGSYYTQDFSSSNL